MNDQIFDKSYWLNSRHISFHKMKMKRLSYQKEWNEGKKGKGRDKETGGEEQKVTQRLIQKVRGRERLDRERSKSENKSLTKFAIF